MKSLKGKTILITGASRGIGRATALLAAQHGANIAINYVSNQKAAAETALDVDQAGGQSVILHGNVAHENQTELIISRTIIAFNTLDILINNAGIISWKPMLEEKISTLHQIVDTNIKGIINTIYVAAPVMKDQGGGVIVNIASGASKTAYPNLAVYSATKFAVLGLTQALGPELEPYKIRVYSVSPGMVSTSMTNHQGMPPSKVATHILQVATESLKLKPGQNAEIFE